MMLVRLMILISPLPLGLWIIPPPSPPSSTAPTQTPPGKSICDSTSTTAPPPNGTLEPPLPGVLPGTKIPKILIAVDIDYPPYAELGPPEDDFPTSGFGPEFAEGLEVCCCHLSSFGFLSHCSLVVVVLSCPHAHKHTHTHTAWSNRFTNQD